MTSGEGLVLRQAFGTEGLWNYDRANQAAAEDVVAMVDGDLVSVKTAQNERWYNMQVGCATLSITL